jgi:hypothetical protein
VGLRQINTCAAKYLYWSIFKKDRHFGFGVFLDIWSMGWCISAYQRDEDQRCYTSIGKFKSYNN